MTIRFSEDVVQLLLQGGWYVGRNVAISDIPFEAARKVLSEFGGLHIGQCGPGVECATSDVHIEPSVNADFEHELRNYENTLHTKLFALGGVHRDHGYLIIAENGKTYLLSDSLDEFERSFDEALERLILGLLPSKRT